MEKQLTEAEKARIEDIKRETIDRNDEEIVRAWQERGLEAPRIMDGRPVSIELYRLICGDGPASQAAE